MCRSFTIASVTLPSSSKKERSLYICGVKSQNLLELDVVMGIAKVFHGFSESGGLGVQFYSGELFVVCRWADVVSVGG